MIAIVGLVETVSAIEQPVCQYPPHPNGGPWLFQNEGYWIDMDTSTPATKVGTSPQAYTGVEDSKTVQPGETVQVKAIVDYRGLTVCPGCVMYQRVFTSWDPNTVLADLFTGQIRGNLKYMEKTITFTAPTIPGEYKLHHNWEAAFYPPSSYCTSNMVETTLIVEEEPSNPIDISAEWLEETDGMIVPYDEVKLKFTIKNNLPTTLHNVKLSRNTDFSDLITLEEELIGDVAPGEEKDAVISITIAGVYNKDNTINEDIMDKIINPYGIGEIPLTNSIDVIYDSSSQKIPLTPKDEEGNTLKIQYPNFYTDPDLKYEDEDIDYYREGDVVFSHTTDINVREKAVIAAATNVDTNQVETFPDDPKDVSYNVFRYVDFILDPDEAKTNIENDVWIFENSNNLDTIRDEKWICIGQAYLFTSIERTLGFPSREIDVAEGIFKIGGIWFVQNGAAEVWYNNEWNFYDPYTSKTTKDNVRIDILNYDDLLDIFAHYKAWYAFDERHSEVYTGKLSQEIYFGHDFELDPWRFGYEPKASDQWKFWKEGGTKSFFMIAGSPIKMLIIDEQGKRVGSADIGIVKEIPGAKYMPPGQIGYFDRSDPSTAFELDEFIFLPDGPKSKYELIVTGTDDGEYTIQFGQFDASFSDEYSDVTTFTYNIKKDEVQTYEISIDGFINPVRILSVNFNIKPGSCTNPINTKSKGVIPAAILGMEDFDVRSINPETILLGRDGIEDKVSPIRWSYEDSVSAVESCDNNDINGDGYADLIFKFDSQTLVNTLNLGEAKGEMISLQLTGNLEDEKVQIEGIDTVSIIK